MHFYSEPELRIHLDTPLPYTGQLASHTGSVNTISYPALGEEQLKQPQASPDISEIISLHNLLLGTTTAKHSAQAEIKSYGNKICK